MALINCPECGVELSDKAIACPKCAFPIDQFTKLIDTNSVASATLICPKCTSHDTQEIKTLWLQQTSSTSQIGIGGTSHGTLGIMLGGGTSQTNFAKSLHPGPKPDVTSAAGGCTTGCGGLLIITGLASILEVTQNPPAALLMTLAIPGAYLFWLGHNKSQKRKSEVIDIDIPAWDKKKQMFEKGWVCLRCSGTWLPVEH